MNFRQKGSRSNRISAGILYVALAGPPLVDEVSGDGTIETYTVEYGRDGQAARTMIVVRLSNGSRTVGNGTCTDDEVRALTESEGVGKRVRVTAGTAGVGDANVPNRVELLELVRA